MNIDLLKNYPSWVNYIYLVIPLVVAVIIGYIALKYKRLVLRQALRLVRGTLRTCIRYRRRASKDIETASENVLQNNETVLRWAASSGRIDVIQPLLKSQSSAKQNTGNSSIGNGIALLLAIQNGHEEAANVLIAEVTDVNFTDEEGATALHWGARRGMTSIVEQLIDKGAEKLKRDNQGLTAQDWAITGGHDKTIMLFLQDTHTSHRASTEIVQSLHFAAKSGNMEVLKELLDGGASPHNRDAKGQTAIYHALMGGNHEAMKLLLQKGANIHAIDNSGFNVLHL